MKDSKTMKKLALVTGSARGLGRAIAETLVANGMSVVISDLDGDAARATAEEMKRAGADVLAIQADVSSESSTEKLFERISRDRGHLHIVVNNAGIGGAVNGKKRPIEEMPLANWNQILAINLTGPFLVSRAAIPLLKRNNWGRIVNITSRSGRTLTSLNNGPYATSKAGLAALSRSMAGELGPYNITVNCVAPSRVDTNFGNSETDRAASLRENLEESPLRRLCTTTDVANAVSFLCSDLADFITGTIVDVNGGTFMAS